MTEIILGPLVGGLTHQTAKLWARTDGPATLYAWVGKKPDLSDAKQAGKTALDGSACAGFVPLKGLTASTRYFYTLSLSSSKPKAGPDYPSFQTFPKPGTQTSFSFAFGSCFLPGKGSNGAIFDELDKRRSADDLRFMLLIGDQIYADTWEDNGLGKVAITADDYRQVYINTWSNSHFRRLLSRLPAFMMLDDHEVDNDWHWDDAGRRWAHVPFYVQFLRFIQFRPKDERFLTIHRVRDAMQAYWEHQGMHAPEYIDAPLMDAAGRFLFHEDDGSFAYTFQFGAVPFFMLDTRTMRIENRRERILLGEPQWKALEQWLLDNKDAPVKFLVSSSTLLFDMFLDFAGDRWGGFPTERERLLKFIGDNDIRNVYVLSGDLHNAHCIEADLRGKNGPVKLWEFCSTPFEQDTNIAAFSYIRPFTRQIIRQKLHTSIQKHNFGVVKVNFAEASPHVNFEVYGDDGRRLFVSP